MNGLELIGASVLYIIGVIVAAYVAAAVTALLAKGRWFGLAAVDIGAAIAAFWVALIVLVVGAVTGLILLGVAIA